MIGRRAGQLDLSWSSARPEPLPITSSKSAHLCRHCARPTSTSASAPRRDEVFRQLVLARIIEPTSKADSLRVIDETGIAPVVLDLKPPLAGVRQTQFPASTFEVCARHARLGPANLVLYDVSTLSFRDRCR